MDFLGGETAHVYMLIADWDSPAMLWCRGTMTKYTHGTRSLALSPKVNSQTLNWKSTHSARKQQQHTHALCFWYVRAAPLLVMRCCYTGGGSGWAERNMSWANIPAWALLAQKLFLSCGGAVCTYIHSHKLIRAELAVIWWQWITSLPNSRTWSFVYTEAARTRSHRRWKCGFLLAAETESWFTSWNTVFAG